MSKRAKLTHTQLREDYHVKRMTLRAMAKKYGVAMSTVRYAMLQLNIGRRKCGRPRTMQPETHNRIVAMRREGYSMNQIMDALGVDHNAVWRVMKAEGLTGGKPIYRKRSGALFSDTEPMVG